MLRHKNQGSTMIMHQPQHTSLVQGVSKSSILSTITMQKFGWIWAVYWPHQSHFCICPCIWQDIRRFNLKASGLSLHHHFSPDQDFFDNFYLFLPFVMKTFNICYEFVSTWNSSSDFYHIHILQHFSCFTHGYYNTIPTDSLGPILTSLEDLLI